MRTRLIAAVAVLLAGSWALAADDSQVEQHIREGAKKVQEAFNHHDAAAVAEMYASDATIGMPNGNRITGKEEIRKHYEEAFNGPLKDCQLTIEVTHCQQVTPEVALCDAVDHMKLGGADAQERKMPVVVVLVRDGEKWLVSAVRVFAPQEREGDGR